VRRTGRIRTHKVPVYDRFDPALEQTLPYAWVLPPPLSPLLEPLRRHGVFVEQIEGEARPSVRAQRFLVDSVARGRPFQGHQEVTLTGRWEAADTLSVEPGSFVVRGGQPLGILALYLLEPQSDDGLTTWNFLDQWLQPGQRYPIVRVVDRASMPLRPVR
jgi:hypothetical protein